MIGGNIIATVQVKSSGAKNRIGELSPEWQDAGTAKGWLDYISGQNELLKHHAKVQESTHAFLCDVGAFPEGTVSETARLLIAGNVYEVLMIDNPMGMGRHLEIYLKYVGGGLGV